MRALVHPTLLHDRGPPQSELRTPSTSKRSSDPAAGGISPAHLPVLPMLDRCAIGAYHEIHDVVF
jgi:hypothetical protein